MAVKEDVFYLPDDPYYFPNASILVMLSFYQKQYPKMNPESVKYLAEKLNLDVDMPIRTFSKGMKRQAFLILALCSGTKYLLCDEVFDGLDPIVTEIMKNLFRQEMKERNFTAVVASHKLKEIEDICENIAILHKGGVVTSGEFKEKAKNICKFQCVFPVETDIDSLKDSLDILKCEKEARFVTLIIRGCAEETEELLKERRPIFINEVPLNLGEIFIAEMEGTGYDIKKVFC